MGLVSGIGGNMEFFGFKTTLSHIEIFIIAMVIFCLLLIFIATLLVDAIAKIDAIRVHLMLWGKEVENKVYYPLELIEEQTNSLESILAIMENRENGDTEHIIRTNKGRP